MPSPHHDQPLIDESVIHDLLNPMTSILGNLHLLQDLLQNESDSRSVKWLAAGLSSVEELSNMLVDLRHLMQVEAGDMTIDPHPIQVPQLLEHVRRLEEQRAAERQRLVITDCAETDLTVSACRPLLERALHILLLTSLRISRSSPIVIEAVGETQQWARFRFNYVGMRIEPPMTEQMFTREGGDTQHQQGPKIDRARGLVFTRRVAEAHGGAAWYEPTHDGGCFILELPRSA